LHFVFLFQDFAYRFLIHQLTRIPNEQIEIYSNDENRLPPKLRLPTTTNKPSPIIIFAKQKFYFTYNAEQNSIHCDRNNHDCQQSSKILFIIIRISLIYFHSFFFYSFSRS